MNECKHSDWLKLWTRGAESGLEITDRPRRLLQDFKAPLDNHVSSLVLIGNQLKCAAFKRLVFSRCDIRARGNGEVHLLSGVLRDLRHRPLIITDTDVPRVRNRTSPYRRHICHEIASQTFGTEMKHLSYPGLFDHIVHRAILPQADVICIFVDDVGGIAACLSRIEAWANKGPPTTSSTRPRILLITGQEKLKHDRGELKKYLRSHSKAKVERSFSSVVILGVPKASGRGRRRRDLLVRRWRVVGCEIARAVELARQSRRRIGHLFSLHHITFFLNDSIATVNRLVKEPYDFVRASRLKNPIAEDLSHHLLNFMKEFHSWADLKDHGIPLIASSFILDHYPPGMHPFDPRQVFKRLYERPCSEAIQGLGPGSISTPELANAVDLIGCSLSAQFTRFQATRSSRDWHKQQLKKNKDVLIQLQSEDTCLSCLRRRPQYKLPCGHRICQVCVRIFFSRSVNDPWLAKGKACPVCVAPLSDVAIGLVPDTSLLRVLSIDGGGIRGAAPLGFLKALEDEVGIPNFGIQRHFDVKFGTSSGGLIVMSLDILGWTVDECLGHLKDFAHKAFAPRSRILGYMSKVPVFSLITRSVLFLSTLLTDRKYAAEGLEDLLMDTYGRDRELTDMSFASRIGSRIGVTLTRARDGAPFIATNYNQIGRRPEKLDYSHLPSGIRQQAAKVWEVLRAATAAPYYFEGKRIGTQGVYQDGGLAFNNPASIALLEAIALTPDGAEPSILLSLGTGSSTILKSYLSIIYEAYPFRVSRALWHRVSSKTSWNNLLGYRTTNSRCKLYRLDYDFEEGNVPLDDCTKIDLVRQKAEQTAHGSPILGTIAGGFRAALFYFQLDESQLPVFSRGRYECVGQIFCRLRSPGMAYSSFMSRRHENRAVLQLEGQSVCIDQEDAHRNFKAVVRFSVTSLNDPFSVQLVEGDTCHDISGSPFTIAWLVRRQNLDASFGTSDHKKRQSSETLEPSRQKRSKSNTNVSKTKNEDFSG